MCVCNVKCPLPLLHQLPLQLNVAVLNRPSGDHPAAFAHALCVSMLCIGCKCHGLPAAILPKDFEVIRPIEADFSVLEILSYSVRALTVCLVGY